MNNQSDVTSPQKTYMYEWYVVSVCMLAYIFSFIDRQILALMIEPIKRDMQLTDVQFSLLHGLAFSLFYAFMGMPIAILADRFSRPRIIAIGIAFWSLATAACGLSKNFTQMFLARLGVGIGEAALSPATYSMLSDLFPRNKIGRALAVYSIGSFIGGGIAFLIGGYVINLLKNLDTVTLPLIGEMYPWQVTFFIVGLPGVLVALLIVLTVKNPPRGNLKVDAEGNVLKPSLKNTLAFLNQHRQTFICMYGGYSFAALSLFSMMSWAPAFLMRKYGLSPADTGYILGGIVLVANTGGVLFGGWLVDWLAQRGYSDAPIRTGVIGASALLIPVAAFSQVESLPVSLTLLAIAMFFSSIAMPAANAAAQILPPNQMRAQVSAVFLMISNLIALGIGTTLVALMTDKVFKNPAAVGDSISLINVVACLLTLVLLSLGCSRYRKSLELEGK